MARARRRMGPIRAAPPGRAPVTVPSGTTRHPARHWRPGSTCGIWSDAPSSRCAPSATSCSPATLGPMLLAGNALHADVTPDAAPSGLLGWLLVGLAQTVGFPVPVGGSGCITDALLRRLARCRWIGPARAAGRTGDGQRRARRRRGHGFGHHHQPSFRARRLRRADPLRATASTSPISHRRSSAGCASSAVRTRRSRSTTRWRRRCRGPTNGRLMPARFTSPTASRSCPPPQRSWPTGWSRLIRSSSSGRPRRPIRPGRPRARNRCGCTPTCPRTSQGDAGSAIDVAGRLDGDALAQFVERMEDRVEARAPGFRSTIIAREVQGPADLERANPSLVGGDISGGTTQLHQQLVFRPVPGLARAETPITRPLPGVLVGPPGRIGARGMRRERGESGAGRKPSDHRAPGRRSIRRCGGWGVRRLRDATAPMTTVLVTGASSGIGAETVAALLDRGADVVATVRTPDAVGDLHDRHPGAALTVELLDVTDGEVARAVIDRHRPDVVVNSAGDALLGAMVDIDDDAARAQLEVMLIGPNRLARFAAEHQRQRGSGRIVNVSSTLARTPLPFTGWYSAAKAALEVTTDVLRQELHPIRSRCRPGRVRAGTHTCLGEGRRTRHGGFGSDDPIRSRTMEPPDHLRKADLRRSRRGGLADRPSRPRREPAHRLSHRSGISTGHPHQAASRSTHRSCLENGVRPRVESEPLTHQDQ